MKEKQQKINQYYKKVKPKLEVIEGWYRNGAIDKTVAENLNIGYSTFLKYKREHPELREMSALGKAEADIKVESALYKNSTGFHYEEDMAFKVKDSYYDKNGKKVEKERIAVVSVKKYRYPDTTAQIFWLKNRMPEKWRDKQEVKVDAKVEDSTSKLNSILQQLEKD